MELALPPADHFAYFGEWRGECTEFFMVDAFEFPRDLEKEFEDVEFCACADDDLWLLFPTGVACEQ